MERLTFENVKEMGMYQLAHNHVFVKDRAVWYRDFDREISIRDLIREIAVKQGIWRSAEEYGLDADNEMIDDDIFDDIMLDDLQYGTDEPIGVLAMFNMTLWGMAELRERLKPFEDLRIEPEEIIVIKQSEDYWHREALKWAARMGESKIEFRELLNQFGIPEDNFKDDELEKFLYANRQQDKEVTKDE